MVTREEEIVELREKIDKILKVLRNHKLTDVEKNNEVFDVCMGRR